MIMKKQIEKIRQWIATEPVEQESQKHTIDIVPAWLFRNLVPVLLTALAINLAIIFITPAEYSESLWFRLKDPLSLGLAYLIFKIFKSVCRHPA